MSELFNVEFDRTSTTIIPCFFSMVNINLQKSCVHKRSISLTLKCARGKDYVYCTNCETEWRERYKSWILISMLQNVSTFWTWLNKLLRVYALPTKEFQHDVLYELHTIPLHYRKDNLINSVLIFGCNMTAIFISISYLKFQETWCSIAAFMCMERFVRNASEMLHTSHNMASKFMKLRWIVVDACLDDGNYIWAQNKYWT